MQPMPISRSERLIAKHDEEECLNEPLPATWDDCVSDAMSDGSTR